MNHLDITIQFITRTIFSFGRFNIIVGHINDLAPEGMIPTGLKLKLLYCHIDVLANLISALFRRIGKCESKVCDDVVKGFVVPV